jgi:hypothetical protein
MKPCSAAVCVIAPAVVALVVLPAKAWAGCDPGRGIAFSYPSAETRAVPVDAVFWAVPAFGGVRLLLDGVALDPGDVADRARYQFAPGEPLSPGMHEVEIQTGDLLADGAGAAEAPESLRFSFEAVETPSGGSFDVSIEAVTRFPLQFGGSGVLHPPQAVLESGCTELATLDVGACNDIIPASLTRLELSASGDALAYLVGSSILPATCRTYFPYEWSDGQLAPYEVRAIVPNGLLAPQVFQGEVELVDYEPSKASYRTEPPGWCSLSRPRGGTSAAELILLGVVGGFLARRTRYRALGRLEMRAGSARPSCARR